MSSDFTKKICNSENLANSQYKGNHTENILRSNHSNNSRYNRNKEEFLNDTHQVRVSGASYSDDEGYCCGRSLNNDLASFNSSASMEVTSDFCSMEEERLFVQRGKDIETVFESAQNQKHQEISFFEQFIKKIDKNPPDFLWKRFEATVDGQQKICIDVLPNRIKESKNYFKKLFPDWNIEEIFDIAEIGAFEYAVKDYAAIKDITISNESSLENGKCYKQVQSGSSISVDDNVATVTAFFKDKNISGRLFIATSRHLFSKKYKASCDYAVGIKETHTYVRRNETSLIDIPIGHLHYGVINPLDQWLTSTYLKPSNQRQDIVDIEPQLPATDLAVIEVHDLVLNKSELYQRMQVNKYDNMAIYREELIENGTRVEFTGAICGNICGTIEDIRYIKSNRKRKLNNKCDYFSVIPDTMANDPVKGDSGSLVIAYNDDHSKVYAYGVVFATENNFYDHTLKKYRNKAWCVRLDNCLDEIKNKWKLDLDFCNMENDTIENVNSVQSGADNDKTIRQNMRTMQCVESLQGSGHSLTKDSISNDTKGENDFLLHDKSNGVLEMEGFHCQFYQHNISLRNVQNSSINGTTNLHYNLNLTNDNPKKIERQNCTNANFQVKCIGADKIHDRNVRPTELSTSVFKSSKSLLHLLRRCFQSFSNKFLNK